MERMAERTIHVLLVEDNPGDARLIRRMLADATAGGPTANRSTLLASIRWPAAYGQSMPANRMSFCSICRCRTARG